MSLPWQACPVCWNALEVITPSEGWCKVCRIRVHWEQDIPGTYFLNEKLLGISYNRRVYMKHYTFTHDWYGKWVGLGATLYWGKTYLKLYLHFITVRITITRRLR